jgi:hypothetical protein
MQRESRKPYPSDVSDEEWAFVAPYLALVREDAKQRTHSLREVFDGLRYIVKTGGQCVSDEHAPKYPGLAVASRLPQGFSAPYIVFGAEPVDHNEARPNGVRGKLDPGW